MSILYENTTSVAETLLIFPKPIKNTNWLPYNSYSISYSGGKHTVELSNAEYIDKEVTKFTSKISIVATFFTNNNIQNITEDTKAHQS